MKKNRKFTSIIGLTLISGLLLTGCASSNPQGSTDGSTEDVPTTAAATNQFSQEETQAALEDASNYVATSYNQTILLDGTWLSGNPVLYQDGPGKLYLDRNWVTSLTNFMQPAIDGNSVTEMSDQEKANASKVYQAYFAAYDPKSKGLEPVYTEIETGDDSSPKLRVIKSQVETTKYDYSDQMLNNGEKKGLNIKTNFTVKVYYTKDGQEGFVTFHYNNMNYLYVQGDGSTAEKPNMNIQSISGQVTVDDWQADS
jgi:outer membrane murein-binding lipoprotein Lpp